MSTIKIKLTPTQLEALESNASNLLLWGPGGSGKTEIASLKPVLVGCDSKTIVYLIRRKKVDLRLTLWKRFCEKLPQELVVAQDQNRMYYRIQNGTEFFGLGLDTMKDVNKLASTECGLAVIEEATEMPEIYFDEKIKRSTRWPPAKLHQTLLCCNPGSPMHWIRHKFLLENRTGYKNIYMPTLPKELGILPLSWYEWLESLTGVFAQRYRDGKWVAVEGVVYPYDPQKHNISREKFNKIKLGAGKIVIAVDFGYEHPFVCQWWYISPEDNWYRYREIYMTNRRAEVHAKDIKQFCEEDGIPNHEVICDHDAENRADLRNAGIPTPLAVKDRLAGQQSVQKLFEEGRIFFVEGSLVEPDMRQVIKKLPTRTEEEFPLYVWANSKTKEDMIKQFDDGMDCMRYAIHTTRVKGYGEKVSLAAIAWGGKRDF